MKIKIVIIYACFLFSAIAQVPEIKKGDIGKGATVFEGETPESFGSEMIGVFNISMGDVTKTPMYMSRLFGGPQKYPILHTGVVGGMSGSPIEINGEIVGALATGGFFNKDPVCGITPKQYMKNMEEIFQFSHGTSSHKSDEKSILFGLPIRNIPLLMSGPAFLERSEIWPQNMSQENFNFIANDGVNTAEKILEEKDIPIVSGSTIAVYFTRGDIDIAVFGTATWIENNTLYAFGHGIWDMGKTALPFSGGSIITTVANVVSGYKLPDNYHKYKLAGTIVYDSPVGIKGIIGKTIPMISVNIALDNTIDDYEQRGPV